MSETFPPGVELMQRTVDLKWYSPEWMLPKAQSAIDIAVNLVDILIAHHEQSEAGYFDTNTNSFCREDGTEIETKEIDFWAYMPEHPTK